MDAASIAMDDKASRHMSARVTRKLTNKIPLEQGLPPLRSDACGPVEDSSVSLVGSINRRNNSGSAYYSGWV